MSVFDVAKNNRGNTEQTVTMSYTRFDEYLHMAQTEERERIIALLEAEIDTKVWDAQMMTIAWCIVLIKGEQK